MAEDFPGGDDPGRGDNPSGAEGGQHALPDSDSAGNAGPDGAPQGPDGAPQGPDGAAQGTGRGGGAGDPVPGWLAGLCPVLPERLFAPYHPGKARYCFRKLGATEDCALVAFSAPDGAGSPMAELLRGKGFAELRVISLDEACDLARQYHPKVNAVALIDDPRRPIVQIVRWHDSPCTT